ncbi:MULTISPECIES: DMT family transporter [Spongiibacter]|uniref:DMT family transporter n=1 Tax=Spongiibacter TaxID=630749 RepID=UPI0003B3D812|nr:MULTISPECIES: quaternary ammonium compound efflux SMR transporter SugE [Spongiibacter]MAY38555.1 QacE family quaternary ammonium compound efflux SMR transporter [Spongiibacter sp.]MBI59241.1 QacE family quaternary ammonium compound efflux SMR transporter [Spongiibacter sp.]MBO6752341.1 quaternary ammonium compound efflux SMR transporter SugE [Spongiibacter sp.]
MNWLLLLVAGCFEIAWAIGLKYTEGFTRPWPTLLTVSAMIISIALLGLTMRTLPVGTAYAVWVGIGAAGTVLFSAVLFAEPVDLMKGASLVLIMLGVLGLKLSAG